MKISIFLIVSVFIVFMYCKKTEIISDPVIKAGFNCGFGSGTDSLEITKTIIKYVYYVPSQSQVPLVNVSRAVPDTEWTGILNDLNIADFVKLHYDSDNISFDGCDEWIFIQDGQISHEIRFSKGLKIDSISKLQNKLTRLRTEFNKYFK